MVLRRPGCYFKHVAQAALPQEGGASDGGEQPAAGMGLGGAPPSFVGGQKQRTEAGMGMGGAPPKFAGGKPGAGGGILGRLGMCGTSVHPVVTHCCCVDNRKQVSTSLVRSITQSS